MPTMTFSSLELYFSLVTEYNKSHSSKGKLITIYVRSLSCRPSRDFIQWIQSFKLSQTKALIFVIKPFIKWSNYNTFLTISVPLHQNKKKLYTCHEWQNLWVSAALVSYKQTSTGFDIQCLVSSQVCLNQCWTARCFNRQGTLC